MANIKKTCLIHHQQGIGDLIFIQKIIRKYSENGFNVICPILIQRKVIRDHFSSDDVRVPGAGVRGPPLKST